MSRAKNNNSEFSSELPPDFSSLDKIVRSKEFIKSKSHFEKEALSILFVNPVDFLDVFFLMAWLTENKLDKFKIDVYSPDQILRTKVGRGLIAISELEEYCVPQGLNSNIKWARKLDTQFLQVDPRFVLKAQCHWVEHTNIEQFRIDKNHHLIIIGPVVSETYQNNLSNALLPCYEIIYSDLGHENYS